eukprot:16389489-Heterocapsa_arctica.AAC.1
MFPCPLPFWRKAPPSHRACLHGRLPRPAGWGVWGGALRACADGAAAARLGAYRRHTRRLGK